MKLVKVMGVALLSMSLVACGTTDSNEGENKQVKSESKEKQVAYEIVDDKKFESTEQKAIRVTTKATKEKDFEQITEKIMKAYGDENLDSLHLYIHAPEADTFGNLKAHSFIAYTQKGTAQVGVDKENPYKIEVESNE